MKSALIPAPVKRWLDRRREHRAAVLTEKAKCTGNTKGLGAGARLGGQGWAAAPANLSVRLGRAGPSTTT
jgi:hypothetical protein